MAPWAVYRRTMSALRALPCALILAAAGSTSAAAAPPLAFRFHRHAAGHHACPDGGAALFVGFDRDRNGTVDNPISELSEYLCDGPPLRIRIEDDDDQGRMHCSAGGLALNIGIDHDRDRRLDYTEVERTLYTCHQWVGPPPPPRPRDPTLEQRGGGSTAIATGEVSDPPRRYARWRYDREAPGDRCPHGGTAIRSGVDRDGNGALDDREIERTAYSCPLVPARSPLRLRTEAPGSRCPAGGTAVDTGGDDDGSGALDPGEVDATRFFCGADEVIDGDAVIDASTSRDELARLARARVITGHLAIAARGAVELPALELVGGSVIIADGATRVRLPALTAVSRDVIVHGAALTDVALPALATVGDRLRVVDARALAPVVLPALTRVGGDVVLARVPSVSAPRLATIGRNLELGMIRGVVAMPALREVDRHVVLHSRSGRLDLPGLERVEDLRIDFELGLDAITLPSLRLVRGNLVVSSPTLARLSLPALERVFDRVAVGGTADPINGVAYGSGWAAHTKRLTAVEMPNLVDVGVSMTVANAPQLATLTLSRLATVKGTLRFEALPRLRAVDLRGLTAVPPAGFGLIVARTGLNALRLPGLQGTDGHVYLGNNPRLADVDLGALTAGSSLTIENSAVLVSLSARNLATLPHGLALRNVPRLRAVTLPMLSRARRLQLENVGLANLDAFTRLTEADEIVIRRNARLTSLDGLRNLPRGGRWIIDGNRHLPPTPAAPRPR
jgi:hypothetical protein